MEPANFAQQWSDELATIAQIYANKCTWGHNKNRQTKTFSYVGENIFTTTGTVSNYGTVVQDWYNEVANYRYSSNTCDPGKVCGHYTQVSTLTHMYTPLSSELSTLWRSSGQTATVWGAEWWDVKRYKTFLPSRTLWWWSVITDQGEMHASGSKCLSWLPTHFKLKMLRSIKLCYNTVIL